MCYDPSDGPQMAVPSNPSWSIKRLCSHHAKRMTLCQDSTAVQECLKMNIRLKLRPDSAVTQGASQPLERLCSCHSEGAKLCQDSTVTRECLSMNINTEKKLKNSSVKLLDTSLDLDLPGPKKINKPSYPARQPEMHQVDTMNPKWPKTNVRKEMKHQVSSNSPRD